MLPLSRNAGEGGAPGAPGEGETPRRYFGWTLGFPPGEPGGGITGMLLEVGAGTFDWMPGSTPAGGVMSPGVRSRWASPLITAGGAIFSGGVGEYGGGGPGGACVLDGGLDGCANAADALSAMAAKAAMPTARRRLAVLVRWFFI